MLEGLWIVQYEGITGGDAGVIVFVNGQVLGGDNAFVYLGSYQTEGNRLAARVLVRNFAPAVANVLGVQGDFELAMQGKIENNLIKGSASLIDQDGPGTIVKLSKVTALNT